MPLKTTSGTHGEVIKGRGAPSNIEGRFETWSRDAADDGWFQDPGEDEPARLKTVIHLEQAKSVISRNESPDIGFSQSINPYRGCAHGCVYCLAGDTPVLMGNGRTLPISEVKVGDEIYGTRLIGRVRRYVKSRVLAHWSSIKSAFRTTLEDGTALVSSGDHRFLTDRGWKHVTNNETLPERAHLTTFNKMMGTGAFAEGPSESDEYRRGYLCGMIRGDGHLASHRYQRSNGKSGTLHQFRLALCDPEGLLRTQDYLLDFDIATHEFLFYAGSANHRPAHAIRTSTFDKMRAIGELIKWPNAPSRDWSIGFLAGIFDAEGSFSDAMSKITNTDPEIIGWTKSCLRALGFSFSVYHQPFETRKSIDVVRVTGGLREQLRFVHTVGPAITRKLSIVDHSVKCQNRDKLRVVSIEPLGKAMRLYDITTETEDFIANGVVSHNCYARPSHAYLGLSPGLDFETRLSAKVNAAEKLREELAKPGYRCETLVIGVNTDAYQPIERQHKITRSILEVASETNHPVALITKSALIERDIDILAPLANKGLAAVAISITTLDHEISRRMEPRTSAPARRLLAIKRLSEAGIPVSVNVAPVIPFLTDSELEAILEASVANGAISAGYILVRLPWEVRPIFKEWLEKHFPLKAEHVMSRIRDMRDGRENDPNFGSRMKGQGTLAELLAQRFKKAAHRLGLDKRSYELNTALFTPPALHGQKTLF
ncbi:MAG: PA0069 family radical SAM protein [Usitatibacter sp.]